jgi:hypothetical protein
MLGYRCYCIGADSRILAMRDFYADSNVEALAMARTLALDTSSHSFELWEGSHFIHGEDC